MRTLMFILFFPFSFSGHDGGKELLDVALGKCERLESLEDYRDILSQYGMTDKLPLACPLKDKFRISSEYGGRIHPGNRYGSGIGRPRLCYRFGYGYFRREKRWIWKMCRYTAFLRL